MDPETKPRPTNAELYLKVGEARLLAYFKSLISDYASSNGLEGYKRRESGWDLCLLDIEVEGARPEGIGPSCSLGIEFQWLCEALHEQFDGPDDKPKPDQKFIFVASPFNAIGPYTESDNVWNAQEICRHLWEQGFCPIATHLYFPQFTSEDWFGFIMAAYTSTLMDLCSVVLYDDCLGITPGMRAELRLAMSKGLPIAPVMIPSKRWLRRIDPSGYDH